MMTINETRFKVPATKNNILKPILEKRNPQNNLIMTKLPRKTIGKSP